MSEVLEVTNNNINNVVIIDYVCSDCDHKFQSKCHLERHKNSKRKCKRKSDDHKCNNCNKNYSNKYNLATHMKKCCSDDAQQLNDVQDNNVQPSNMSRNTLLEEIINELSPNPKLLSKVMMLVCSEQNRLIDELKNDKKNIDALLQKLESS